MPRQHLGERALARAVDAHDGMHFASTHGEVDTLQDFHPPDSINHDFRLEVFYFQQYLATLVNHPTLPSSFSPSNLVASTANSIGRCTNTSLQKPLMIIETASSEPMPRCAKKNIWSSPILDVEASCSTCAVTFCTSIVGNVFAPQLSPISIESHCEKFLAPAARLPILTRPR